MPDPVDVDLSKNGSGAVSYHEHSMLNLAIESIDRGRAGE